MKRCRATRGSPSALPSSRAGPTVLTAARASPFRGFSNSTYRKSSKSYTKRDIASNEISIPQSSSFSPRRSSSQQPRPAEERHQKQIRGTPCLIGESDKASAAKRREMGCSRGRPRGRRGRQRRWRGRRQARPMSQRPWRRPPDSCGPRRLRPAGDG